jgi:hypothetical protein
LFVSLAQQQNMLDLTSSSPTPNPPLNLNSPNIIQTFTSIHNHAKLLACWGLLPMRLSENRFAQHEFAMFLNHLDSAILHLNNAIKKTLTNNNNGNN